MPRNARTEIWERALQEYQQPPLDAAVLEELDAYARNGARRSAVESLIGRRSDGPQRNPRRLSRDARAMRGVG
jgi:hypothetical protein